MSKPEAPLEQLFVNLLDDAAMFPPGNASPAEALASHLQHRVAPYADFIGPLLVHVNRWGELSSAHAAGGWPPLDVVVLGSTSLPAGGPRCVGFEVAVSAPEAVDGLAEVMLPVAVEIGDVAALPEVLASVARQRAAGVPMIAKYRTGGTTADAFPSEAQVADVICAAIRSGVPVKFTAGLHRAIRHTGSDTGFEHHGYLNLMAGVRVGQRGGNADQVMVMLRERQASEVVGVVSDWSRADIDAVRSTFVSFGCCGVREPLGDAVALGLLSDETP